MSSITTTAQDTSLELAVRGQNFVADLVERMQTRLSDERGQTAAEYMGILVIIAAIIVAITGLNLDTKIRDAVETAINSIAGKKEE